MKSVWVGTDWHVWSAGHTSHHPYQSVSNIRQLSDSYANDIQVDDVFIYLGDLCDPAVTDLNELKRLVQNIPGYKILVKGNHDTETDYFYRDIGFDEVCDVCVINQVAFSHFPLKVEPDMINIHGHLHNEKRSDVDDANHINAYREDYYKHPIEISELIQNAYDKWLKDRAVHRVGEITDAKTGKAYDASRILYLTDIFEEDMLKPVDEAFVGNDEVSTTYLMSLSTVDTEEKLLKWIRQNLHVGPMGKVKTDIEMARSRSASDFDIALFVNPRLRKLGHNPRLMVFIGYEPNNPKPGFVHMFNYWVDLDDSVTWFEASWRGNEGIHEFENIDDMKTEILSLYRDRIESNKYTETIFHSVNPSYLKPGRDPQEILKDVFGEDGLVNESFAIRSLHNSNIKVDDQDYGDDGLVSCIDWFCDMVQLGSQVIYIKTTNRIRNLWAITEQNSSPLGGRGIDYSYVINLDMVPKNIDKFSLMKFVCLFDILVTTSDQRTIEAGCPNALCAAIAYWYSQPYYDQLFELPEEYMHPSKEVQNWFNMIQCYQRTINNTAVDLLVRDLFWNKEVDPKILISSVLKNSMIACDVNNESAMSQYEHLLSLNEVTYDLSKYTDLIIPGTMQSSPFSGKKITSFVDDLLDANIKITPETIDKIALKQVKSAQDLVDYYNSRLESFTDYSSGSYLGSADLLWTLLFNMDNFSVNNWEKFIPMNLTEVEFAQYMDKRFAELDEIEKMYQDIMINNIGAMRLSEAIIDAKSELDVKDSKLCKVSTNIPANLNIHDIIQIKISIIKTKIKQLRKISKQINTDAVKSTSDVEFGFITVRNTNKKDLYPRLECIKENVDFRHRYTHFAINDYIYALESAKTVFKWMDKVYFNSMPETGYYWTYQHDHCPILMVMYDNPVVGGAVFSTIDECISDARDYLDDIHGSGEYTINVYKAVKGHPLPGQRIRIDESTFIDSHDVREGMTITIPEEIDNLNEILMEPEDAHLFLADDEAGEKSQKPYKIKLSTDDQGVIAESFVYDPKKFYKNPIDNRKFTLMIGDLLEANIKINPETIDRDALAQVKSTEDLKDYYNTRLSNYKNFDKNAYLGSAALLSNLIYNLKDPKINVWENFVPTGLSKQEFASYMETRFRELDFIESMFQKLILHNINAIKLADADSAEDIQSQIKTLKKIVDKDPSFTTTLPDGTRKYTYGEGFGTVYVGSNIYNDPIGFEVSKPSRFIGRAALYDIIVVNHGKVNEFDNTWQMDPIYINTSDGYKKLTTVDILMKYLGKKAKVLLLICNPDGKILREYTNVNYPKTRVYLESAEAISDYGIHESIMDVITIIKIKQKSLDSVRKRVKKWYKKNNINKSNHNFGYLKFYVTKPISLLGKIDDRSTPQLISEITNTPEFDMVIDLFDEYIYFLNIAKEIFKAVDKIYFKSIPETGYYWIHPVQAIGPNPLYSPEVTYGNPIIRGMKFNTIDECIEDIREYASINDLKSDVMIYETSNNQYLPGLGTDYGERVTRVTIDSIINEDAYQLQGIDRDQQDVISKKYGIRAVGHETEEEIKYREEREKAERERKAEFKKKQKDKQLAKARKAKKKIAKKRELEKKKEEFKSKFSKKNEEVDISDIPYNDGSRNFFDSTPGVANADFVNETGYKFEILDKVKFFDPINESTDDRTLYPVYVLCVHTGTLLANAIKKATGSHFSHCTISFDSSLKNMYSFGRKTRLTELSNGSFVKESIHNPPYTNEGVTYALYCIPVTSSQLAAMKKRLEYFVKNKTKFKYDFAGLFKNFFGIADNPEQRWFCSRFVADIINAGTEPGQKPMIREPSLMRPEDFLYTNYALYVTSGLIKDYDQILVDKVTKKLLRIESIRRAQQRAVQSTNIPVTESAVLDVNPYDPLGEAIFNYQMATMDESAYQNFKKYLHSFKIKLDKDGNIIIHRREVDQLDKYFREANQLLKVNMKAGNEQGVVDQLCRVHYMINLINKYYLISTTKQNTTVKADLKKQLIDLRSVMINVYQQYLSWVTARNPQFNFQTAYDASIYSDKITVPKEVITSIGRVIMTML